MIKINVVIFYIILYNEIKLKSHIDTSMNQSSWVNVVDTNVTNILFI